MLSWKSRKMELVEICVVKVFFRKYLSPIKHTLTFVRDLTNIVTCVNVLALWMLRDYVLFNAAIDFNFQILIMPYALAWSIVETVSETLTVLNFLRLMGHSWRNSRPYSHWIIVIDHREFHSTALIINSGLNLGVVSGQSAPRNFEIIWFFLDFKTFFSWRYKTLL